MTSSEPKRPVSQAEFDAAVKDFMDELDLDAAEAIDMAREEFEMQGGDITAVEKNLPSERTEHPVTAAFNVVRELLAGGDACSPKCVEAMAAVTREASAEAIEDKARALVTVHGEFGVQHLLDVAAVAAERKDAEVLAAASRALAAVMSSPDNKKAFQSADGGQKVRKIIDDAEKDDWDTVAAAATIAEAAATKAEGNKCALYDNGAVERLVEMIDAHAAVIPETALVPMCGAIGIVCVNDDEGNRVVAAPGHPGLSASRAFATGIRLGKIANPALLRVLQAGAEAERSPKAIAAVKCAVRRVSVNDETVGVFMDAGGIPVALKLLETHMKSKAVAYHGLAMLRQMAASDTARLAACEAGALELALAACQAHGTASNVVEQALGTVAALLLRNPDGCERAAGCGWPAAVAAAMRSHEGSGPVQRQGCMLVRNLVARNAELRPVVAEAGAEGLIRAAMTKYAGACKDVGSAALRDLGCDDWA
ncbi:unnamed protein product [Pedinophyceae sp. YPF-701]|nr:unnamed protein product [Pedinophyceae sp. YPF-701]